MFQKLVSSKLFPCFDAKLGYRKIQKKICLLLTSLIVCSSSFIFLYDVYTKTRFDKIVAAASASCRRPTAERTQLARKTTLNDVTITIRTSGRFHHDRIRLQRRTWMKKALDQTFIITDEDDEELREDLVDGHLVVSKCGKTHSIGDLCCKTSVEFDTFVEQNTSWCCRFDDDMYVNPTSLVNLLNNYDPLQEFVYIGTQSHVPGWDVKVLGRTKTVHYVTGAGYCFSKSLRSCMAPWVGEGNFQKFCRNCEAPEDVAMGALLTVVLNVSFIETFLFHSPYDRFSKEQLNVSTDLKDQAAHSHGGKYHPNFANYKVAFNEDQDPTRFLSIHCVIYPDDEICPMTSQHV